ncbi:hypothetical protein T439DRAFT_15562 [Meredithblackwellia eburnea MCA 4105]
MAPSKSNMKNPNGTEQQRNFLKKLFWIGLYGKDEDVRDWRGLLFKSDQEMAKFVNENLKSRSPSEGFKELTVASVANIRGRFCLSDDWKQSSSTQPQELENEFKEIFEEAQRLTVSLSKKIYPATCNNPLGVGWIRFNKQLARQTFDSQFGPRCHFSEHQKETIDFYNLLDLSVRMNSTQARSPYPQEKEFGSMIDLNPEVLSFVLVEVAILDHKGKTDISEIKEEIIKEQRESRSTPPPTILPVVAVEALYSLWRKKIIDLGKNFQSTRVRALFSAWLDQAEREPSSHQSPGLLHFLEDLDNFFDVDRLENGPPLSPLDQLAPGRTPSNYPPDYIRPSVEVSDTTTNPNHNHDHPSRAIPGHHRLLQPLPAPRPNLVDVLHKINPTRGSRSEPPQSRSDFESTCALLDIL